MIFRLFAALAFGLACAVLASAQHTPEYFRYRPEKISVGTVHHYVKTNIDGSQPEHVSLYVAARDRIESFKFHPPRPGRAALVIAEMDWQTFSARRLESWQVFANDERKLFATLDYLPAEQSVSVSIPSTGKPTEKTRIGRLPFHVYNFDLASLNFAFRHLVDPRRGFTVGLADPTFQEQGPVFRYRGEATVTYVGDERRGGAPCRKYRAGGDGLDQRGGFIWVNRRGGYFQDVEIELPDNSA
ncbi:MAG: hypothetical protein ACRD9R_05665, partial [Pyrinomonadaceae bacterium]